jgi:broad specificity phosphatase PhoE
VIEEAKLHINLNINSLPDQIVFCRHAESVGNAIKQDDESTKEMPNHQFALSPNGKRQLKETAEFVKQKFANGFAEYYVSTFLRTQLTFAGLFTEKINSFEDPRLDEWWKGIFHSLSLAERQRFYPNERITQEREGWYHYRPPQGESGKDVEIRILSFLYSVTPLWTWALVWLFRKDIA